MSSDGISNAENKISIQAEQISKLRGNRLKI